ncbi:hypothetical protein [Microvirga arsenatis]|uniref:GAF domain-containing protein n=1 Tax=Microvirga arsenatis TaxID=2692265 RepID=A0ABW9Z4L0_9HYPH|nr:hypothetical protein [Microvirga arsenatis]NBJ13877.1 hypothetical protein [Microvirga arsenatis]NBJ27328.1 hypothetical protein [Microvirga arsenatis]
MTSPLPVSQKSPLTKKTLESSISGHKHEMRLAAQALRESIDNAFARAGMTMEAMVRAIGLSEDVSQPFLMITFGDDNDPTVEFENVDAALINGQVRLFDSQSGLPVGVFDPNADAYLVPLFRSTNHLGLIRLEAFGRALATNQVDEAAKVRMLGLLTEATYEVLKMFERAA